MEFDLESHGVIEDEPVWPTGRDVDGFSRLDAVWRGPVVLEREHQGSAVDHQSAPHTVGYAVGGQQSLWN